jgi:hypothetical protein
VSAWKAAPVSTTNADDPRSQRSDRNRLDRGFRFDQDRKSLTHAHSRRQRQCRSCAPLARAVDLLPARKEECSLTFKHRLGSVGRSTSRQALWSNGMTINVTRRAALIGLSTCVAVPARAQTTSRSKDAADAMTLQQSAVFDIAANTGSLKETVQKGQQLVWRQKGGASDGGFQVSNISIAFLRSESGGQVKMTFSGNVSSLGYLTSEEAKLNVNVRAKGGASLHSWSFGISVKCADKDQPLTPLTHDVPTDVAANVFTNVSTVEVAEPADPNFPGVKVQRCN